MLFVQASCRFIVSVMIFYSQEYHYHTDIPFSTYLIVIGLFIPHNTHVKYFESIAVVMWKQYALSSDTIILTS